MTVNFKKIIVWKTKWDKNLFSKFPNSTLSKEGEGYFFENKIYRKLEKIQYSEKLITLDENLLEDLKNILDLSHNKASQYSPEPMGKEITKNSKYACIYSAIHRYGNHQNFSIIDNINCIFIRLIRNHYLYNGNKRMAFAFLVMTLWNFGFYFKWTSPMVKESY